LRASSPAATDQPVCGGIDEDEVEMGEPGVRVVHHRMRRRGGARIVGHDHALGAERAQVQPDRGRARSAVEGKTHRAPRRLGALQQVVGGHHRRLGRCSVRALGGHRQEGGADRIVQARAVGEHDAARAAGGLQCQQLVDAGALARRLVVGHGACFVVHGMLPALWV
jgi:hypothetical protein